MSQSRNLRINRDATFAASRGSGAGLVGAILIHLTIIFATLFTFAHKLDIVDESPPVVPVDLVTVGTKNDIAPTVTRKAPQPAEQQVQAPPQPPAPVAAPPPTPPQAQEQEAEQSDQAPSEPVVKPVQPLLDSLPKPQLKPQPPAAPKAEKPAVEAKKPKFDINNIMAMLGQPSKSAAPNARVANKAMKGVGAQDASTADLQTALASQVMACWSPPVGAPRADDLIVDFDLQLNRDGSVSVSRPPQLTADSRARADSNLYTRAAAEAAKRAIFTCSPYRLPANRYSEWQEINPFHFDPRQMTGQ